MRLSPKRPSPEMKLYELHFPRLVAMATAEFQIPRDVAIPLVHDLLLTTALRLNTIADPESWLNGALRSAALRLTEVRS